MMLKYVFYLTIIPQCGYFIIYIVKSSSAMAAGVFHGQQRIHPLSQKTEEDTKADSPTAWNLS